MNKGFTLIELIVVIVILGVLAVTAAPRFLNLQSDARISRLEGIKGSLASAFQLAYGNNVIHGRDSGHWGNNLNTFDLDDDGNNEFILWGYPMVYNTDTLRDLIDLDMCIVEAGEQCDGVSDALVSEFTADSAAALKTSYILRSQIGGSVTDTCKIIIHNAELSADFSLVSAPNVELVGSGC